MSGLADHGDKCQCSECTGPRGLKACLVCDSPSALGEIERLRKQVTELHLRRAQAEDESNARGIEIERLRAVMARLRAAVKAIEHVAIAHPTEEASAQTLLGRLEAIYTMAVDALAGADYFPKET